MSFLRREFTEAYDSAITFTEQYESYQKISDYFAIKFIKWIDKNFYQGENYNSYARSKEDFGTKEYKIEDLIVMFKQEVFRNIT